MKKFIIKLGIKFLIEMYKNNASYAAFAGLGIEDIIKNRETDRKIALLEGEMAIIVKK